MNIITKKKISNRVKDSYIIGGIAKKISEIRDGLEILKWIKDGRPPSPPDIIYREKIIEEAKKEEIKIFVETGTLFGDTVRYVKDYFEKVYSIEVKKELYEFSNSSVGKFKNVEIIHGDSKKELKKLLSKIDDRALFWLDAHCSEGITGMGEEYTPIVSEIENIIEDNENHVILIDDLRLFKNDDRYPSLEEICKLLKVDPELDHEKDMIIVK